MSQVRLDAGGLTNSRLTRPCQRATSLSLMRGVRVWLTVRRNGADLCKWPILSPRRALNFVASPLGAMCTRLHKPDQNEKN
jgi:hypothetical protein